MGLFCTQLSEISWSMVRDGIRRRILEFAKQHADADTELRTWFAISGRAEWKDLADVRGNFTDADQVGRVLVFNVRHNTYRLIMKVDYRSELLMVKQFLTHKEYGRGKWC